MGTEENRQVISSSGFDASSATGNDLVIALECESTESLESAILEINKFLNIGSEDSTGKEEKFYDSLKDAFSQNLSSNLCLISIPGQYVLDEAIKALNMGLNLFIFSDNVLIEDEIKIKKMGIDKNLLVMGPDCGVGNINGYALATSSVVRKGSVGIIGASGSGAQEIACLLDKNGYGVSQLIGTGGRDIKQEVVGLTMLYSIDMLEKDEFTNLIILVSKLADASVVKKILDRTDKVKKPVVAIFLGATADIYKKYKNITPAFSLEEAAVKAMSILSKKDISIGISDDEMDKIADGEVLKYSPTQRYLRGLYCGGTFMEEALIIMKENINATLYSNIITKYSEKLEGEVKVNILIDMGSEEFTKNKPHPVIDPSSRVKKFAQEASDDSVAVIVLDFILSYGVHPDPVGAIIEEVIKKKKEAEKQKRHLTIISSVCGTDKDPQDLAVQEKMLKDAGVIVTISNAQSAKLASRIILKISA
jgi:FdrA protein